MGGTISSANWVKHFSAINNKDPALNTDHFDYCNMVEKEVENLQSIDNQSKCPIFYKNFSLEEILEGFKRLKKGKATAFDALTNDILRAARDIISPILAILFNKLASLQYFPIQWKTGLIVPIHKGGEENDPDNFRGITLNNSISKLYTLLLNDRLTYFCENNDTVKYNQIGYRKGFRTSDHVFTLKTLIDQQFANKKNLYTCCVDFRKAYDTV